MSTPAARYPRFTDGQPEQEAPSGGHPEVARFAHGSRVPGWDTANDLDKPAAEVPEPAITPVPSALRDEIEAHMAKYPDRRSAALPALGAAQRWHGWCSPEAIDQVACVMRLTPGYLTAVATFYDMLATVPSGRHHLYVCTNISCSLWGADELFDAFRSRVEEDPDFNLRSFECLGACDIAPMASVDGVYVGPLSPDDVPALIDDVRAGRPVLADKQLRRRACADPEANSEQVVRAHAQAEPQDGGQPHTAPVGGSPPPPQGESFGPPMDEDAPGPAAAIEHAPEADSDPGESSDGEKSAGGAKSRDPKTGPGEDEGSGAGKGEPREDDALAGDSGDHDATSSGGDGGQG